MRLWAAYALTELALSFVPGPAVLLVASQGTMSGTRRGAFAALSVVVGNSVYFAVSALGLGSILIASAAAFDVLRWIGVAYLVFLGLRLATKRGAKSFPDDEPVRGRPFVRGIVTQLANPKALVFFTIVLPPFVTPRRGAAAQFALLGATSVVIELPVLVLYGWLASRMRGLLAGRTKWRDRVAGTLIVGTGARLAFLRGL